MHSRILLPRSFCYADAAQTRTTARTYPNKRLYNTWNSARERLPTSQGPSSILILFQKKLLLPITTHLIISRRTMSASSAPPMIGALPPPPGVTPNFIDPYSIGEELKAAGILFVVLTTISTAIRLHTKLFIIKTHGWEDCKSNFFKL